MGVYWMLKDMKIGKRLIVSFILVTLISSISGIIGLTIMKNNDAQYSNALINYGFAQGTVGRLSSEFNTVRATMRDIDIKTDQAALQKDFDSLDQSQAKINQYLSTLKTQLTNDKEKEYYNTIQTNIIAFNTAENWKSQEPCRV